SSARRRPRRSRVSAARLGQVGAVLAALAALHWLAPAILNPDFATILARLGIAGVAAGSPQLGDGFNSQFSIGPAGFMALGAYASAAFSVYLGAGALDGLGDGALARLVYFPLPLVCGGLVAAAAGLVVAVPTLRLRGDYLAIATLGAGEIIRIAILNV